jgi:hypothetical protein
MVKRSLTYLKTELKNLENLLKEVQKQTDLLSRKKELTSSESSELYSNRSWRIIEIKKSIKLQKALIKNREEIEAINEQENQREESHFESKIW